MLIQFVLFLHFTPIYGGIIGINNWEWNNVSRIQVKPVGTKFPEVKIHRTIDHKVFSETEEYEATDTWESKVTGNTTLIRNKRMLCGGKKCKSKVSPQLHESVDWRTKNAVTPVRMQGTCGSCWAFAVVGVLEGQIAIKRKKLVSLSEQNLIDCIERVKDPCNDGSFGHAWQFILKNKGVALLSSYPYTGRGGRCDKKVKPFHINVKSWVRSGVLSHPEGELQRLVATIGPIIATIDMTELETGYKGGVYRCRKKTGKDHAVLVVGYGKDPRTKQDYWLIKNSYGTSWGEHGYFRVVRGEGLDASCGLGEVFAYPKM